VVGAGWAIATRGRAQAVEEREQLVDALGDDVAQSLGEAFPVLRSGRFAGG
jgi:hypothetical protein